MNLCFVCRNRPANQTGSHIFTLSLIKSAINQVGKTERGKELTFGISSEEFLSLFFGSKVLPEKLEEILGDEVTDQQIQENKNPFTIDNIVCTDCERRFTTVENFFFEKIQIPLNESTIKLAKNKKYGQHVELIENYSLLTRVYFYIQLWRASVAGYENFKLDIHTEEKLRKIINHVLTHNLEETTEKCLSIKHQINQFPIVVSYANTTGDDKVKTENVVYIDQYKEPHFLILNDFYLQFYCNAKHINRLPKSFFGLNDVLANNKCIIFGENNLILNILKNSERKGILFTLYRFVANLIGRNYIKDFISKFYDSYGYLPSPHIISKALNLLTTKYQVVD